MLEPYTVGVPKEGWIQIANGHIFHPMDPVADEVHIEDIAQSLSRQNRYNGHSDKIICVAQHSVNIAWLAEVDHLPTTTQLALLMHDAPEYITGDMISPMKAVLPGFQEIETSIMAVINQRFDLPIIPHKLMKHYDNLCLAWEKRDMYWSSREWPKLPDVPEWYPPLTTWTAEFAETRFLHLFHWLMSDTVYSNDIVK